MPRKIDSAEARRIRALRHEKSLAERFWQKVDKSGKCWIWTGGRTSTGYGIIGKGKRGHGFLKAHRASWIINVGSIPDRLLVLHKCDNPLCVKPDHLFLGTYKDNSQDMVSKGRGVNQYGPFKKGGVADVTNSGI